MTPFEMLKGGMDPQKLAMSMLQNKMGNSPMWANIISLVQQGKYNELEMIARNMCQSAGKDYNTEMARFRKNMGL